jgi:hypothetical protein
VRLLLALVVVVAGGRAWADGHDVGYIGRDLPSLEVDDCPPDDEAIDAKRRKASEHFDRGVQLYAQGDYLGAVNELVSSYCLVPYYRVLKDIGQAYERKLEYGKAIGYFLKYVHDIPPGAKRDDACSPDPQVDAANISRRVDVLRDLPAHVRIETSPDHAQITLANDTGVTIERAPTGQEFEVKGGRYELTIEKDGFETVTMEIKVDIGKPYTYFRKLDPKKGWLRISVTPNDAKLSLNDTTLGTGRWEGQVEGAPYYVKAELEGYLPQNRRVVIVPNQENRVAIELAPQPQVGRRQLIAYSGIGGLAATGALLRSFQDYTGAGGLALAGGVGGVIGGYFIIPSDVPLGTSSMTITSSLIGGVVGAATGLLVSDKDTVVAPLGGAGLIAGAAIGYYVSDRAHTSPGDAALINTGALWGTAAGGLFAASFHTKHTVTGGLILSGIGMGTIGGVLFTHNFSISRTHAALIDLAGFVGVIGGLAVESLVYPTGTTGMPGSKLDEQAQEHLANFALGGMAIGLIAGGILTRDIDAPKISPAFTTAPAANGKSAAIYGISGSF